MRALAFAQSTIAARPHRHLVHAADFSEFNELITRESRRLRHLAIDPPRRIGIAFDLQVLRKLLVARGSSLIDQALDLVYHKGVSSEVHGT